MTVTSVAKPHTYSDVEHTTFGQNAIMIEMAYAMGRAYQWAREFGFNSIEAGATLVSYTADFVTARNRGIYRRVIADNGSGMTRAELSDCINKIGGGLSKRGGGSAENLGQGAKVASAYFNPAGVVYLTRSIEDGDAIAVYVRDDSIGEYGLLRLWGLNDDDEIVRRSIHRPQMLFFDEAGTIPFDEGTDWQEVMDEAFANIGDPDSGTAVVFMGDGTNDTIFGDPEREAESSKYGLAKYLESRIWDVPESITIRVLEFRIWTDKSQWPTSENDETLIPIRKGGTGGNKRMQWRHVKGLRSHLYNPTFLVDKGSVAVTSADGIPATIDWVITKFASTLASGAERKGDSSTEINPGGIGTIMAVSAAAKAGLYDVMDFVSESAANPRFRQFGIDADTVQEQIWMTITPQVYRPANRETGESLVPGVGMDPSRSHLVATSTFRHSEPIETLMREWGRDFQSDAKFPSAIKALLEAAWASGTAATSALDAKTTTRIAEALKGALTREVAIIGGKKPKVRTTGTMGFRRRVPRHKGKGGGTNENPPRTKDGEGAAKGGDITATGKRATKASMTASLPEVHWVPGDNPAWASDDMRGSLALFRLPGRAGGGDSGVVWLKGHDPETAPSDRKHYDGTAYAKPDEWVEDESPVVLAAVQDKQSEYGPAEGWAVEKAVKGSYMACAQAVAAHLLAQGKWDPDAMVWDPTDGVTVEMMDEAIKPFNFSNSLRGYYPQKQIAAGFLGSLKKAVRGAAKRAA